MSKKIVFITTLLVVFIALGIMVDASGSRFKMDYLPGTDDSSVSGLPETNYGEADAAFTVSSQIPTRAGYSFISWKLDYGGVQYTVLFKEYKGGPTDKKLQDSIVGDSFIGDTIPLTPADIAGYELYGVQLYGQDISTSQTSANLEITENADHNTVTFWYTVKPVKYTVYFKEANTNTPLYYQDSQENWVDYMIGMGYPGETVTVEAKVFDSYALQNMEHSNTSLPTVNFRATLTLSANPNENIVNCFYYKTATLTVRYVYIDRTSGALCPLYDDTTYTNVEVGSIWTEYPIPFNGFKLQDETLRNISIEIQEDDNLILFVYVEDYPDIH